MMSISDFSFMQKKADNRDKSIIYFDSNSDHRLFLDSVYLVKQTRSHVLQRFQF